MSEEAGNADGAEAAGGKRLRWWQTATFAAGLTAVCTGLVAFASFLSAQAASNSDDLFARSALELTDANFFLEQGTDALVDDLQGEITRLCLLEVLVGPEDPLCNEDELSEAADFLLSDDAIGLGLQLDEAANAAFEEGLDESKKSVGYQGALVLFAVGLALSAWAALSDTGTRARVVFEALAVVSVGAGLVQLVRVAAV